MKRSRLADFIVRKAFWILALMLITCELASFIVISNWLTISAYYNSFKLNSLYEVNAVKAYHNLLNLDEYAVPVLAKQVAQERDNMLFNRKMAILAFMKRLDAVPVDAQVKYYFLGITKSDWEASVGAMQQIVRLGKPAVPYVIKMLNSGMPLYEYCSLCILAEIADSSIAPQLLPFLSSKDDNLSKKTFWALDKTGSIQVLQSDVTKLLSSEAFRDFDEEMKEYSIRLLAKLASPELDAIMKVRLEQGRPFESRMAAGYLALSKNLEYVKLGFSYITQIFIEEEARLEFLNCLRDRRNEPEIQELLIQHLADPEDGLGRFVANQVLVLAELDQNALARIEALTDKSQPNGVAWDAAIVLCYHGDKSCYPVLADAISKAEEFPELSRSSRQAAIALGESQTSEALEILARLALNGSPVSRVHAIQWGLRIYGINEGDWKLPAEAKVVYGVLKRLSEDINQSLDIRRVANAALQGISSKPGTRTGPTIVDSDIGAWRTPIFTGKGKPINDIIKQNFGTRYFEFPRIEVAQK